MILVVNENMTKILDLPSKKFFIKDLQQASRYGIEGTQTEKQQKSIKEWLSDGRIFSVVWIQGTVLQVSNDTDMVLIDDSTGVIKVVGCRKIPFLSEKLQRGQYVMIIGQMLAVGYVPVLRALKFQNLSTHTKDLESCWILEVLNDVINKDSI